jgi:glycine/D-amino acid oxidase-like deaminating enzyme
MFNNKSPWVEQLKNKFNTQPLDKNHKTDILIIGAGISGITTAYYILKNTNLNVTLVEAKTLASGATGHNAGQLVSYFEKQISNIVKEFGFEMAVSAQKDINSSWFLLEQIYQDTGITTNISISNGYAGIQTYEDLVTFLQNAQVYKKAGLIHEKLSIAEDCSYLEKIPQKFHNLFSIIKKKNLMDYLETNDSSYYAMISVKKGMMNSALFCEDLLNYIFKNFSNRFNYYDKTPVSEIRLHQNNSLTIANNKEIYSNKIVLCTNGFEKIDIINKVGNDINTKFHHLVIGVVGYMAGYLEEDLRKPTAIGFLPKKSSTGKDVFDKDPYFYFTRRDYEIKNKKFNLICIGGPEAVMDDSNKYKIEHPFPKEAQDSINNFLHKSYKYAPKGSIDYKYIWHGLMGYTPNGIRLIGIEPLNKNLLYNLGCNGVGILPSIFGANKISKILSGEKFEKSIFDPSNFNKY